jgi:DNA processing protein
MRDPLRQALLLRRAPGVGDAAYRSLIERFGAPEAAWRAAPADLAALEALPREAVAALQRGPAAADAAAAAAELEQLARAGYDAVALGEPAYPAALATIFDPPAVLYVAGRRELPVERAVAIVGSRRASDHGLRVARRLGSELAERGVTVVSGLARGIDGAAHAGALDAGGATVAVIGCGLDQAYPPEHRELQQRIAATGSVASELPLGTKPLPGHFPRRNRIISGLCAGVVIVEAGAMSGALITARLALEQGREVFAVPGAAGVPGTAGSHRLLRDGARLVERVDDILEELQAQWPEAAAGAPAARPSGRRGVRPGISPDEQQVLGAVVLESPRHIDEVTARVGMAPSQVAGLLLNLELKGAVRRLDGQRFIRT